MRAAFANALHMAAARGRVVLVLDALNQLEDRDRRRTGVAAAGDPGGRAAHRLHLAGAAARRPCSPGLAGDDGGAAGCGRAARADRDLPGQYPKTLSEARAERLAAAPQAANPLYLRALLEELRLLGAHETLDERIEGYLSAATLEALYERVLARYEGDYERERPGLVRDAMTLCGRRGGA